jgi:hypothetical protein
MPGKPRFTPTQIIAALKKTKGMVYLAAKQLRCDPDTILNYCKRYPAVERAKQALRGEMVDLAEIRLAESIQKGEAWGIAFALKTLGKDRGYVERQELTGQDGQGMVLRVVYETPLDVPLALPAPATHVTTNGYQVLDVPVSPDPP